MKGKSPIPPLQVYGYIIRLEPKGRAKSNAWDTMKVTDLHWKTATNTQLNPETMVNMSQRYVIRINHFWLLFASSRRNIASKEHFTSDDDSPYNTSAATMTLRSVGAFVNGTSHMWRILRMTVSEMMSKKLKTILKICKGGHSDILKLERQTFLQ